MIDQQGNLNTASGGVDQRFAQGVDAPSGKPDIGFQVNTAFGLTHILTQAIEDLLGRLQQVHLLVAQRANAEASFDQLANPLHQLPAGQGGLLGFEVLCNAGEKGFQHRLGPTRTLTAKVEFTQHQIEQGAHKRQDIDNQQPG